MSNRAAKLKGSLKYKLPQLKLCLVREGPRLKDPLTIRTPADAAKYFSPLNILPEEHFVSLHLNARHEVIGIHEVSHGTLSSSLVHPREVFKAALLSNSHAMIVCHNHPSGSRLLASPEDIDTTAQLLKAAAILGISLLDHLIVGSPDDVYSIREHYPGLWTSDA